MKETEWMALVFCLAVLAVFSVPVYGYDVIGWGKQKMPNAPLTDLTKISAGRVHSLALTSDGSIVGWGDDSYGQATPPAGNDFVAISANAGDHSLALRSDGSIVGWAGDWVGQATPPAGNDFVAIDTGVFHSLALRSDGSIVGWGEDGYGQATPPTGSGYVAIAAGCYHSLALKEANPIPPTPSELLDDLAQHVADLNLHKGTTNSLNAKLNSAMKALTDTNEHNDAAASHILEAFINEVEAQKGKKIPEQDADDLIDAAQQIIDLLNSE
ncbi:MAG: hypothetical protein L0Y36_07865 [Planctomycetales bacterium]|nr:hypothetical protein [Planctomycetales bacterium]